MKKKQGAVQKQDDSKTKVKIISGAGWYKNHVGEVFEVEKDPIIWRDGMSHYQMENPFNDGWTYKLIECKDVEIING